MPPPTPQFGVLPDKIPQYKIDLLLEPRDRFKQVATDMKPQILEIAGIYQD